MSRSTRPRTPAEIAADVAGMKMIQGRADCGNVDTALRILEKAPDVPPESGDEIEEVQNHDPSKRR